MWELNHKDGWTLKNWCFQTVMLEKTLESPLDCKEIKSVNLKQNQHWRFIGRTDAEAEVAIIWPPDVKSQLIRKDHDAGKEWRQEEKGTTEDEMVGLHQPSPTWLTLLWASFGRWWWTRKPGMLQFMVSQTRTRLNNWTELVRMYTLQLAQQF